MTKTITIDYKGGSRRIDIQLPPRRRRVHHVHSAPSPLTMTPKSLSWMNSTLVLGSELDKSGVEALTIENGFELLKEILDYWTEETEELRGDSEKGESDSLRGFELNDEGAVDLEDYR